nr:hypothetical protein [Tanacetum cinerariifolium]
SSAGVARCVFVGDGSLLVGAVLGRSAGVCQLAADAPVDPCAQRTRVARGRHPHPGVDAAGGGTSGVAGFQPGGSCARRHGLLEGRAGRRTAGSTDLAGQHSLCRRTAG